MSKRKRTHELDHLGWIYNVRDKYWNSLYIFKIGKIKCNAKSNDIRDDITKRYHTYYIDLDIVSVNEYDNYHNCEKLIHNLLEPFRNDSSEIFMNIHPKLCEIIIKSVGSVLENEDCDIYIKKKAGQKRKLMDITDENTKIKNDDDLKVPIELWLKIYNTIIYKLHSRFNIIYNNPYSEDYYKFICELNLFFMDNYKLK